MQHYNSVLLRLAGNQNENDSKDRSLVPPRNFFTPIARPATAATVASCHCCSNSLPLPGQPPALPISSCARRSHPACPQAT